MRSASVRMYRRRGDTGTRGVWQDGCRLMSSLTHGSDRLRPPRPWPAAGAAGRLATPTATPPPPPRPVPARKTRDAESALLDALSAALAAAAPPPTDQPHSGLRCTGTAALALKIDALAAKRLGAAAFAIVLVCVAAGLPLSWLLLRCGRSRGLRVGSRAGMAAAAERVNRETQRC